MASQDNNNNNKNQQQVLLCGGGNAIHVLTAYVGALEGFDVSILSLFPGEADRLRTAIGSNKVCCQNDLGADVWGAPVCVSEDPSQVVPNADIIIFALPSFTHTLYLQQLKPFLREGVILGAMPGEGGFDLTARHVLGEAFCGKCDLFALETLPWACRIVDYGKVVEVLGTKQEIDVVITPKLESSSQKAANGGVESVVKTLQTIIGKAPALHPAVNFLAVTLMNINSVWHPTISYGYYRNHEAELEQGFDEPPLFYQGADEYTGNLLDLVSDEVLELKRVLKERYPSLDLSDVHHVRDWMLTSYGSDIGDTSSTYKMLLTNKGYRGLTHPMVENKETGKFHPNFRYRYFSEDIPCGLMVTRGIAELAGVATPHMDQVIYWCQDKMQKEYLTKEGKVAGKDLGETRAPQHYGFSDLDSFMKVNHYVPA